MRVREYLELRKEVSQVTFIKARARKDAATPRYHQEYQTTPLFYTREVFKNNMCLLDYIILNDEQEPIEWLSGSNWKHGFKKGIMLSMLVVSEEDFALLLPSKEQRESIEKYITKEIEKKLERK